MRGPGTVVMSLAGSAATRVRPVAARVSDEAKVDDE
jgi:hypothetical protein